MKIFFTFTAVLLSFFSCVTSDVKENEMRFSKTKSNFHFKIGNSVMIGRIESIDSRFDILMKINDDILTGEINSFYNNTSFSLIYKNNFIKGTFSFDDKTRTERVNFNVLNRKLSGEINYSMKTSNSEQSAIYDLVYNETPLSCRWTYYPDKVLINWQIKMDNKSYSVSIKEKAGLSEYSFEDSFFEDDGLYIIFILLEFHRMIN